VSTLLLIAQGVLFGHLVSLAYPFSEGWEGWAFCAANAIATVFYGVAKKNEG